MRKIVVLNEAEIAELDRQNPGSKNDGGFQKFLVYLQEKVRRGTKELILEEDELERIARYAFDYEQGGWEDRLIAIFGRTLGPQLGRETD